MKLLFVIVTAVCATSNYLNRDSGAYRPSVTADATVVYAHGGDEYFCADVKYTNPGMFESTHWSTYLTVEGDGIEKVKSFTSVKSLSEFNSQDSNYFSSDFDNDTLVLTGFSEFFNGHVKSNSVLELLLCVDLVLGAVFEDFEFTGKTLFVFDTVYPELPMEFEELTSDTDVIDGFNDCYPVWPNVSGFGLVSRSVSVTSAVISGRVMTVGDLSINDMFETIGESGCTQCYSGNTVDEATFVVGGKISDWTYGASSCGGYFQGYPRVSSSMLYSIPSTCPRFNNVSLTELETMWSSLETVSSELRELVETGHTGYYQKTPDTKNEANEIRLWFTDDGSSHQIAVFNIPGELLSQKYSSIVLLNFVSSRYDSIVLNIDGADISFNSVQFSSFRHHKSKLILNMHEAITVKSYATEFFGSIMATKAEWTFLGGGDKVFGNFYVKSVLGEVFYMHPFPWIGMSTFSGTCYECGYTSVGDQCEDCGCTDGLYCDYGIFGTGTCSCARGWNTQCNECLDNRFGSNCQSFCTDTCILNGNCFDGLEGNGSCTCSPGYIGEQCSECEKDHFGSNCQSCPVCSEHGECIDGITGSGECVCSTGWSGALCDTCATGYYGDLCQYSCSSSCTLYGKCDDGFSGNGTCLDCNTGVTGDECEYCEVYDNWGSTCSSTCSDTCIERGVCDSGPGGEGLCSDCSGNFAGEQCNECLPNTYGENCSNSCSETCLEYGICDDGIRGSGNCSFCLGGRVGSQCEISVNLVSFPNKASNVSLILPLLLVAFIVISVH